MVQVPAVETYMPTVVDESMKLNVDGKRSVTTMFAAVSGPLFVITTVNLTWSFRLGVKLSTVCVSDKSATGVENVTDLMSSSLAVALPGILSKSG